MFKDKWFKIGFWVAVGGLALTIFMICDDEYGFGDILKYGVVPLLVGGGVAAFRYILIEKEKRESVVRSISERDSKAGSVFSYTPISNSASQASMKCSSCGQEIKEGQKYCIKCGHSIGSSNSAPSSPVRDNDGQKDYSLFHKVSAGYFLKYQYENDLCTIDDVMDYIVGNGGKEIKFVQEPDNPYDGKAVAVYLGDKKLGYVYRGQIQDMINDFIARGDAVVGYLNKYSKEEKKATYKVGFYRPLSLCESRQYTLVKTGKKADEYTKRSENLEFCNEGEEVTVSFDYESDSYVVYNSLYDEIGELPKKAAEFIGDADEDSIGGTFDSLDYDENDKPKAKVTIYLIK